MGSISTSRECVRIEQWKLYHIPHAARRQLRERASPASGPLHNPNTFGYFEPDCVSAAQGGRPCHSRRHYLQGRRLSRGIRGRSSAGTCCRTRFTGTPFRRRLHVFRKTCRDVDRRARHLVPADRLCRWHRTAASTSSIGTTSVPRTSTRATPGIKRTGGSIASFTARGRRSRRLTFPRNQVPRSWRFARAIMIGTWPGRRLLGEPAGCVGGSSARGTVQDRDKKK